MIITNDNDGDDDALSFILVNDHDLMAILDIIINFYDL